MPILMETSTLASDLILAGQRTPPHLAYRQTEDNFSTSRSCQQQRRPRCPETSPAKRRLDFGGPPSLPASPPSSSSSFFAHAELDRVAREESTKWNFDFVRGVPLPGRFLWEPCSGAGAVGGGDSTDDDDDGHVDSDEVMSDVVSSSGDVKPACRRQMLITDVFMCRKRRSTALSPKPGSVSPQNKPHSTSKRSRRADCAIF